MLAGLYRYVYCVNRQFQVSVGLNLNYGWDACTVPGFMKIANTALLGQTVVHAVLQSGGHCIYACATLL